jgi:hypothetical protein
VRVTLITGDINVVRVDHNNLYNFLNGWCLAAVVAKCEVLNWN